MDNHLTCIVDTIDLRASSSSREPGCDFYDVLERVNMLPGGEVGSALYFAAACIFKKMSNREIFVVMARPELQIQWLEKEVKSLKSC